MKFATLKEAQEELTAKRKTLKGIFAEADVGSGLYDYSKVKSVEGDSDHVHDHVQASMKEINDLKDYVDEQTKIALAAKDLEEDDEEPKALGRRPGQPDPEKKDLIYGTEGKSIGQLFAEIKGIDELLKKDTWKVEVPVDWFNFKTLFQTSAGFAPESTRTGRLVEDAQRPAPVVANWIPTAPTRQAAVVYMEETTFTNAAAERSEGGAYAEATIAYTEQSSTVRSVGVSMPVTDEQVANVAGMMALLQNRLRFMVAQRLDLQILAGDGSAPNLDGTLNVSGIATRAKGVDSGPDAVYKLMNTIRTVGFAEPTVTFWHPNDWQDIRLLQTIEGVYIFGSPMDPGPLRIWGVPVQPTTAATEHTVIVGDYQVYSELRLRQGLEVEVGFVGENLKTV